MASALVSAEMVASPFEPTSFIIGVIRPVGVATAMEISAFLYLKGECSEKNVVARSVMMYDLLSDDLSQPCRVRLWYIGESARRCLDDEIVHAELGKFVLLSQSLVKDLPEFD